MKGYAFRTAFGWTYLVSLILYAGLIVWALAIGEAEPWQWIYLIPTAVFMWFAVRFIKTNKRLRGER
jgi:F0F1-type ATP synthase assembly protein I